MLYLRKYQRYRTRYANTLILKGWVFVCVTPLKNHIFWNNTYIRKEGPDLESGTSQLQNEYKICRNNWPYPRVIAQNIRAFKCFNFKDSMRCHNKKTITTKTISKSYWNNLISKEESLIFRISTKYSDITYKYPSNSKKYIWAKIFKVWVFFA